MYCNNANEKVLSFEITLEIFNTSKDKSQFEISIEELDENMEEIIIDEFRNKLQQIVYTARQAMKRK